MNNNLKIIDANTQAEKKNVQQQQKFSLAEKKELGELEEKMSLLFIATPAVPFIKTPTIN